jgi:2-oxo-4-hydroxy-4-carboxy-5-ureidoimidazoline decarboxylase
MTATATATITLDALNNMPEAQFVERLGAVFEHSPWVAAQVASARPFASVDALHKAMIERVEAANKAARLALIQAHPELAGTASVRRSLTRESTREQAGAGLDQCSPEEYQTLIELNEAYTQKFGFPFILAVRSYDRAGIIAEFQRRLALAPDEQWRESLQQVYKIARFRLDDLIAVD